MMPKKPFISVRTLPLLGAGFLSALTCLADASEDLVIGPLLSRFPLTLDEGERTEALGPLFYEQQSGSEHTFAIPPFFSHV